MYQVITWVYFNEIFIIEMHTFFIQMIDFFMLVSIFMAQSEKWRDCGICVLLVTSYSVPVSLVVVFTPFFHKIQFASEVNQNILPQGKDISLTYFKMVVREPINWSGLEKLTLVGEICIYRECSLNPAAHYHLWLTRLLLNNFKIIRNPQLEE